MIRTAFLAALALVALASSAFARTHHDHRWGGLHPQCNVLMPCEVPMRFSRAPAPALAFAASHEARTMDTAKSSRKPSRRELRRRARGLELERKLPIGRAIRPYGAAGGLVETARNYLGQTAAQIGVRRSLWCSAFLRRITGAGGVDDRAISWLAKPRIGKQIGAIAVMRHHVGVVSGFDPRGNPVLVSGNHGHRVGEGVYSARRVLAYVSPQ